MSDQKTRKFGLLLAGALAPLAFAPVAAAQAPATPPAAENEEEIVVTARRVEERLQDVPLSVTAISGAQLEQKGAENIGALQGAVPNLNIAQGRGSSSSANVFIRGVGQPDALATFDPGVGIYVDDVYISRIRGALFDVYDIGRIEVLRGPQGTLYGKNTIGGAVKIVSKRPTDDPEFSATVTAGEFETVEGRARLAGPIVDGVLRASLSAYTSERGGYVTDPSNGKEYNDKSTRAGRVGLYWTPTDKLDVVFNVDYTEEDPALTVGKFENTLFRTDFTLGRVTLATPAAGDFNFRARTTNTIPNSQSLEHLGGGITATYELTDSLTIKSITAGRELKSRDYIDIDGTQFELGDVFVGVDQDQVSQELQFIYDGGGPFRLVSGVYGLREHLDSRQTAFGDDLFSFGGVPINFERPIIDSQKTTSYAAFAQGEWDLSDQMKLSVGLRGTRDTKEYFRWTTTISTFAAGPFAGLPVAGLDARVTPILLQTFRQKASWQDVSPAATLTWTPSRDLTVYGRVSKGFKSGGFNGRANGALDPRIFNPETLVSWELGAKGSFFGGRLTASAALFDNTYEDFQARVSRGDPATAQFGVINAGELEQRGAELELALRPVDALTLSASFGWLDAEYTEFLDPQGQFLATAAGRPNPATFADRSWQTPAFSPDLTARFAANYKADLGEIGSLNFFVDTNYRGDMALAVDNADLLTRAKFAGMFQEAYWLTNARVAWSDASDRFTVAVIGRNLADEKYRVDAQEFSSVAGIRTSYWGAPRTVLVSLGAKF
jgi:iron complex outermembrane receptor protein